MASILGKPGGPGQFPTHDLSTVRGALHSGGQNCTPNDSRVRRSKDGSALATHSRLITIAPTAGTPQTGAIELPAAQLAAKLLLDYCPQGRQVFLQGLPNSTRRHVFVVVAIEVAGCGHFSPRNVGVARLQ